MVPVSRRALLLGAAVLLVVLAVAATGSAHTCVGPLTVPTFHHTHLLC